MPKVTIVSISNNVSYSPASAQPLQPHGEVGDAGEGLFGKDGLGFGDIVDTVNPLQHIPVVSTLYREITGDAISAGARIAGGGLFGGVLGLASSAVNAVVEAGTGKDLGEHAIALFGDATQIDEVTTASAAKYAPKHASELIENDEKGLIALLQAQTIGSQQSNSPTLTVQNKNLTATARQSFNDIQVNGLGIDSVYKQTQLLSSLDKTALDMKS